MRTAGHIALPSPLLSPMQGRMFVLALAALILLSGCGAKPKTPTAPIRTHFEEAMLLLPRIADRDPWQRLSFNNWEQLRARAGLAATPHNQWAATPNARAAANLQAWLTPPSTIADADALAPFGMDGSTLRWQVGIVGPNDVPMTRLLAGPQRNDRAAAVDTVVTNMGYARTSAVGTPSAPVLFQRTTSGSRGMLPSLIDPEAAAMLVTPTTLLSVHDASRIPDATAALASSGPNLDSVPFFHGLAAGISEVDAFVLYRVGADGYRDATAPPIDAPYLPFDAVGAGLHITDAGTQYVTLAFHLTALPGGRLPDGMADWWASRFSLDAPDPRTEYLEAFGNDGWLFARYRILTAEERTGGILPGEVPFWESVRTWRSVQQRWSNFAPRTADPIPQLGH